MAYGVDVLLVAEKRADIRQMKIYMKPGMNLAPVLLCLVLMALLVVCLWIGLEWLSRP